MNDPGPHGPFDSLIHQKGQYTSGSYISYFIKCNFQPSVDDYDPERFLRCHSKGNNPDDEETKIWTCAFEPRLDRKGEKFV